MAAGYRIFQQTHGYPETMACCVAGVRCRCDRTGSETHRQVGELCQALSGHEAVHCHAGAMHQHMHHLRSQLVLICPQQRFDAI